MKFLLAALATLLPTLCLGDQFPALYTARDARPDDTIAIKDAPYDIAATVATVPYDQAEIEIVALDDSGDWGWVNAPSGSGWVPMARLERRLQPGNNLVPRPLICFGNEPFWTLDIGTGPVAELGWLGETPRRFFGLYAISSTNRPGHYALLAESRGAQMSAIVQRQLCVDGMSDRFFGLGVDILMQDGDDTQLFSGCCSLIR